MSSQSGLRIHPISMFVARLRRLMKRKDVVGESLLCLRPGLSQQWSVCHGRLNVRSCDLILHLVCCIKLTVLVVPHCIRSTRSTPVPCKVACSRHSIIPKLMAQYLSPPCNLILEPLSRWVIVGGRFIVDCGCIPSGQDRAVGIQKLLRHLPTGL